MAQSVTESVTIDADKDEALRLPARAILDGFTEDDARLHNRAHGLGHPLATYNTTMSTWTAHMHQLLDSLEDMPAFSPGPPDEDVERWVDDVLHRTDAILDGLLEHLDALGQLLRCFYPTRADWYSAPAQRQFRSRVRPYREHLGRIDNHLKHNAGTLCFTLQMNEAGVAPGYFVEQLSSDGVKGPHLDIHDAGMTAFSFNRDIRLHVVRMALASKYLAEAITDITGAVAAPFRPNPYPNPARPEGRSLYARVASLPTWVFGDEATKDWPSVTITSSASDGRRATFSIPSSLEQPATLPGEVLVRSFMRGDGVTRTFRMPYMAKRGSESSVSPLGG